MNISFDPEHRSLYIKLKQGESIESEEVKPGIVFDYDKQGNVIGIDIDDAAQGLDVDTRLTA